MRLAKSGVATPASLALARTPSDFSFFPHMVLDLLRQHFHFRVEVFIVRRAGADLNDQRLGAIMLDLRFLEQPLVHMAAARRIKDLLLQQRMHHQLGADITERASSLWNRTYAIQMKDRTFCNRQFSCSSGSGR